MHTNINKKETRTLDNWNELLIITRQVNYDHLLVIISERHETFSYDNSFDLLPKQLEKYFSNNSFVVAYPNQQEKLQSPPFSSNLNNESQHYE